MIIPIPSNISFNQWVEELCRQNQSIPYPIENWKLWCTKLFQNTQFEFINPDKYSTWQNWAWDFLLSNQGK